MAGQPVHNPLSQTGPAGLQFFTPTAGAPMGSMGSPPGPMSSMARSSSGAAAVLMAEGAKEESLSKDALVGAIAEKAGVSKKTAGLVLSATLDVIVDSVCQGSKVSFLGFGTFRAKERPAREVRNPRTGEKIAVDAKAVPTFSFGSKFKEAVKSRVQVSGS